jgi:hypothetical protein
MGLARYSTYTTRGWCSRRAGKSRRADGGRQASVKQRVALREHQKCVSMYVRTFVSFLSLTMRTLAPGAPKKATDKGTLENSKTSIGGTYVRLSVGNICYSRRPPMQCSLGRQTLQTPTNHGNSVHKGQTLKLVPADLVYHQRHSCMYQKNTYFALSPRVMVMHAITAMSRSNLNLKDTF